MAINLQQFLAKQLSDGVIDQQLCDLLTAVADLSKEINDKVTHGAPCRRSRLCRNRQRSRRTPEKT